MRTGAGDHGSTPFTRGIYRLLTETPQRVLDSHTETRTQMHIKVK